MSAPVTGILRGKHAVVTGGGRGIGAAIASALAAEGAAVTLMGRTAKDLERLADTLSSETKSHAVTCDVSSADSVTRAFDDAVKSLGPVQILVNNAGQADAALVQDIALANWERILAVNLTGTLLCTQRVLAAMVAARHGRIINIASTAGLRGYATVAAYAASKHGVVGLTRSLAAEIARSGVTVNVVCPGYTEDTEMLRAATENVMRATGKSASESRAILVKGSPRGSFITMQEIADTVTWLCSDGASAINGQAIAVDAGETRA